MPLVTSVMEGNNSYLNGSPPCVTSRLNVVVARVLCYTQYHQVLYISMGQPSDSTADVTLAVVTMYRIARYIICMYVAHGTDITNRIRAR